MPSKSHLQYIKLLYMNETTYILNSVKTTWAYDSSKIKVVIVPIGADFIFLSEFLDISNPSWHLRNTMLCLFVYEPDCKLVQLVLQLLDFSCSKFWSLLKSRRYISIYINFTKIFCPLIGWDGFIILTLNSIMWPNIPLLSVWTNKSAKIKKKIFAIVLSAYIYISRVFSISQYNLRTFAIS